MKVLIVYYSFTGQAQRAAEAVAGVTQQAGHVVATLRIDFADDSVRLQRPLTWSQISAWGKLASQGETAPIVLSPSAMAEDTYDLVLLFSNTWSFSPAVPVQSLLKSEVGRRLLNGRPVAIYVICRGFWRRNLAITTSLVQAAGGHVIGGEGFTHPGAWLTSTVQTVRHMMSTSEQRRWGLLPLPAFGLSDEALSRARHFTRRALEIAGRTARRAR